MVFQKNVVGCTRRPGRLEILREQSGDGIDVAAITKCDVGENRNFDDYLDKRENAGGMRMPGGARMPAPG